jgi:hypothetical protein
MDLLQARKMLAMNMRLQTVLLIALACAALPAARAQSGDESRPLGDVARELRKSKAPPAEAPLITNENMEKMRELIRQREQQALAANPQVVMKTAQPQGPQVTCSFAFNAQAPPPATNNAPLQQDLPDSELVKLEGPAVISGDTLQLSVYNGTSFHVEEITVGLTIVRREDRASAGMARVLPASANSGPVPMLKKSDITLLYHLKGSSVPGSTSAFQHGLGMNLREDQEWHWAILQARGVPGK